MCEGGGWLETYHILRSIFQVACSANGNGNVHNDALCSIEAHEVIDRDHDVLAQVANEGVVHDAGHRRGLEVVDHLDDIEDALGGRLDGQLERGREDKRNNRRKNEGKNLSLKKEGKAGEFIDGTKKKEQDIQLPTQRKEGQPSE